MLYALSHYDDLDSIINREDNDKHDDNYFTLKTEDKETYEFYWRKIPTNNTEFYVLVGISEKKIAVNKSVDTCKAFIGILNFVLTLSLYGNIFIDKIDKKDEK